MTREEVNKLGEQLGSILKELDIAKFSVTFGYREGNLDCRNGNAIATLYDGKIVVESEALYLYDAILLAKAKYKRTVEKEKSQKDEE